MKTLDKIAKALGVAITELIEDVPEEGLPPKTGKLKKVAEDNDTYRRDDHK